MYKKRKKKKKRKKICDDWIWSYDLLIKKLCQNCLSHRGWDEIRSQENIYIMIYLYWNIIELHSLPNGKKENNGLRN
jgi:hypothetical protein